MLKKCYSLHWKLKLVQSKQVSTWLPNISFHLLLFWLQTLVAIDSESWTMPLWVWLLPSSRFCQHSETLYGRKECWALPGSGSAWEVHWIFVESSHSCSSKLTTSWWLQHFRSRFSQPKLLPLDNFHCFSAIPNVRDQFLKYQSVPHRIRKFAARICEFTSPPPPHIRSALTMQTAQVNFVMSPFILCRLARVNTKL